MPSNCMVVNFGEIRTFVKFFAHCLELHPDLGLVPEPTVRFDHPSSLKVPRSFAATSLGLLEYQSRCRRTM
jgi:hypothetical protein